MSWPVTKLRECWIIEISNGVYWKPWIGHRSGTLCKFESLESAKDYILELKRNTPFSKSYRFCKAKIEPEYIASKEVFETYEE